MGIAVRNRVDRVRSRRRAHQKSHAGDSGFGIRLSVSTLAMISLNRRRSPRDQRSSPFSNNFKKSMFSSELSTSNGLFGMGPPAAGVPLGRSGQTSTPSRRPIRPKSSRKLESCFRFPLLRAAFVDAHPPRFLLNRGQYPRNENILAHPALSRSFAENLDCHPSLRHAEKNCHRRLPARRITRRHARGAAPRSKNKSVYASQFLNSFNV